MPVTLMQPAPPPPTLPSFPALPDSTSLFDLLWNDPHNTIARVIDQRLTDQQATITDLNSRLGVATVTAMLALGASVLLLMLTVWVMYQLRGYRRIPLGGWVPAQPPGPTPPAGTLPQYAVATLPQTTFRTTPPPQSG